MVFYLVGLGLSEMSLSLEAMEALKGCDEIYLEGYTVSFPYSVDKLKAVLGLGFKLLGRKELEEESFLDGADKKNIALMVYGDPLLATTHYQLLLSCKREKIKTKVFHNASVLGAVSNSGLSPYKFGKTASVPDWKEHTNKPTSFASYLKENRKIGAHSLVLFDIGLDFREGLEELLAACEKENLKIEKAVVFSRLGTEDEKIFYGALEKLNGLNILEPYCMVIPAKLNFFEEKSLEEFSIP